MCPNRPRQVTVASYTSYHRSVHADDTLAAPGVFKSLWGLLLLAPLLRAHCAELLRPCWTGPADASSPVEGTLSVRDSKASLPFHEGTTDS